MKGFRQGTNRNSETMDVKYGDISIELREFRKTVKDLERLSFRTKGQKPPINRGS